MKAQNLPHPARHAAILPGLFLACISWSQETPSSSLAIARAAATGPRVTVRDAANHLWVMQTSTNLLNWTEVAAWKVFNGEFHASFSPSPGTVSLFFRAVHDPMRADIPNTAENALRLPALAFNYAAPLLPPNFLVPPIVNQDNTPASNVVTDAGASLGRVLFYDKRLSTNRAIACASCHQQAHGFSDPRRFSDGFNGGVTSRNSMGLTQARYYPRGHFFWDERAATLEDQVLQPIQNAVEMGMTLPALVNRLSVEPFYTNLFAQAFGSADITAERLSRALAQFVRTIISTRSKYDRGIPVGFSNFTAQESLGRQVFLGQVGTATCAACHGTDNFVPNNLFNNGLENPYRDKGVGALTGLAQDEGRFKVPSLRNIELTAPYMHDGRFATLEEVVEFYNSGVVNHPNLSPPLRVPTPPGAPPGPPRRLNLTAEQKAALVAFLKTLTDPATATDPRFSDPFNYGN
jgi:cytochrome c peroxidase